MVKHVSIEIYGRVQNVFFRRSAEREARQLGVNGSAENRDDGAVYIEAEGEEENLKKFVEWCRTGPDSADVLRVDTEWSDELTGFETFEVK